MGKRGAAPRLFLLALLFALSAAVPWLVWPGRRQAAAPAMEPVPPKLVALTFDDGPNRSTTTDLLDGLSRRGAKATFFLIGTNVEGCEDLIRRMDAEGHQVGVHSYSHQTLTGLNAADFYAEVGAPRETLEGILGHDSLLLRPPYGKVDAAVQRMAGCPIILWSVDPQDWSDRDSGRQTAAILSQVRDGDIILLHDIYPASVETALRVVDALHQEGFYFVTVDELFAAKGIPLEPGEVYTRAGD